MGNGNNPSTKADLFSVQQSPDAFSSSASGAKSSLVDQCWASFHFHASVDWDANGARIAVFCDLHKRRRYHRSDGYLGEVMMTWCYGLMVDLKRRAVAARRAAHTLSRHGVCAPRSRQASYRCQPRRRSSAVTRAALAVCACHSGPVSYSLGRPAADRANPF